MNDWFNMQLSVKNEKTSSLGFINGNRIKPERDVRMQDN